MKKILLLSTVLLSVLFESCQIGQGLTQTSIQTNVVLDKRNFKVIGKAEGTTTNVYVLGLGGFYGKSAEEKLLENANLKDGQALINVNVDMKSSCFLGLAGTIKRKAVGTIIEFTDSSNVDKPQSSNSSDLYNDANEIVTEDIQSNTDNTVTPETPANYKISYMKKWKRDENSSWIIDHEEMIYGTLESVMAKTREWNNKVDVDYLHRSKIKSDE